MKSALPALAILVSVAADSPPRDAALPARVDLGPEMARLGLSVRTQGDRNTCSLFAVTALASFEAGRPSPAPAKQLSEEFLVWAANEATGLGGDQAMFFEAVHGLSTLGLCTEDRMPYGNRPRRGNRPSMEALSEARALSERWKVHWIKRWDVKTPLSDAQMVEIKQALASGHLVACGLRWPRSLRGSRILEVPSPDGVYDGHSIAFTGYQDDPEREGEGEWLFRNSAGAEWGNRGEGALSYAYARAYLNDALWLELGPPFSEKPTTRVEAEAMPLVAHERCEASPQDMNPWGARMWSGGAQLLCRTAQGGSVELGFDVPKQGRYRVRILATTGPELGVVQPSLDGQRGDSRFDLYSGRISPSGPLELGTLSLTPGVHKLRLTSVGKNLASTGHAFGLDAVEWIAVE